MPILSSDERQFIAGDDRQAAPRALCSEYQNL